MKILVTGATGNVGRLHSAPVISTAAAVARLAAVAAVCLLEDGHEGRSCELTGPESITRRERVEQIGTALGRRLTYVDLPHAELVAQLGSVLGEHAGWYADGLRRLAEHPQVAVPTVAALTGAPGITSARWAAGHTGLFR